MSNAAFRLARPEPCRAPSVLPPVLPLGLAAVDALLPGGGFPCGTPVELMGQGVGSAATSFALCACRAAQQRAEHNWCAFIDPTRSLSAAGVALAGLDLERLLVARPAANAIEPATLELLRAQAFAVVVVDLQRGLEGGPAVTPGADWLQAMARAVAGTGTCLLLLTESAPAVAGRSARVDTATGLRLELERCSQSALELALGGRGVSSRAVRIPWSAVAGDSQRGGKRARAPRAMAEGSARHA